MKPTKNQNNTSTAKTNILFLCTGNSCRSQMAEGWANHLHGDRVDAYSAGIEKHGLNPLAVKVMAEAGIDISTHKSKTLSELPCQNFGYVITVCDNARESCPIFQEPANRVHKGFDDPPTLAKNVSTTEEALTIYRRVRDDIKTYILSLPASLLKSE